MVMDELDVGYISPKRKKMAKLRSWAAENRIKLYVKVKQTASSGYMQNGYTRKGSKLYCIENGKIYSWGGINKGWLIEEGANEKVD